MSGSSTPTPDEPRMRITRTVAIIKNHALKYRLTIERRIEEAGFEVRSFIIPSFSSFLQPPTPYNPTQSTNPI